MALLHLVSHESWFRCGLEPIYIPRGKGSLAKTSLLQPEDLRLVRAYLRTYEDDSPYLLLSTRGIPLGTPVVLGLEAEVWPVDGDPEGQAVFACAAPCDRSAS